MYIPKSTFLLFENVLETNNFSEFNLSQIEKEYLKEQKIQRFYQCNCGDKLLILIDDHGDMNVSLRS
jgi:hypothetical protein